MTLKATPEDFVVEEVLTASWRDCFAREQGPLALYRLRKRGLTTPDAVGMLARALNVPFGDVKAAGLKDRHALTTQYVTVRLSRRGRARGAQVSVRGRGGENDWSAELVGFADSPLDASAIAENRFELVVRGLTRKKAERMETLAARLRSPLRKGSSPLLRFTNYYGNQRFGGTRGGKGFLARKLIDGDFVGALELILTKPHRKDARPLKNLRRACGEKWGNWRALSRQLPRGGMAEPIHHLAQQPGDAAGAFAKLPYFEQQIAVEAYQSFLWNRTATGWLADCLPDEELWTVDEALGRLVFPAYEATAAFEGENLPVLGKGSKLNPPWARSAQVVLAEEEITSTDQLTVPGLERPRFGEVRRQLLADATDFRMQPVAPDERQPKTAQRFKRHLRFVLPRGSYATVLMRALGS